MKKEESRRSGPVRGWEMLPEPGQAAAQKYRQSMGPLAVQEYILIPDALNTSNRDWACEVFPAASAADRGASGYRSVHQWCPGSISRP